MRGAHAGRRTMRVEPGRFCSLRLRSLLLHLVGHLTIQCQSALGRRGRPAERGSTGGS